MDYGKFKFDTAQRAKESRRKTTNVGIKEMKYRPKIGIGDFDTKTRQVAKFLDEGHKVKITIMFRGREVHHPELGKKILDRIAEQMDSSAKIEAAPKLDGRNMIMVLAPDRRARQAAAAKADHDEDGLTANGTGTAMEATGTVTEATGTATEATGTATEATGTATEATGESGSEPGSPGEAADIDTGGEKAPTDDVGVGTLDGPTDSQAASRGEN